MSGLCYCPHCGHDLVKEEQIDVGDFRLRPRGAITWRDQPIYLTASEHLIFAAMLRAPDSYVPVATLFEIAGSDSDGNSIQVLVHRTRKKVAAVVGAQPIATKRNVGYGVFTALLPPLQIAA